MGREEEKAAFHTVKEWVALKSDSFRKALQPMQSSGGNWERPC